MELISISRKLNLNTLQSQKYNQKSPIEESLPKPTNSPNKITNRTSVEKLPNLNKIREIQAYCKDSLQNQLIKLIKVC